MEKFKKLSRDEMRNVLGGDKLPACQSPLVQAWCTGEFSGPELECVPTPLPNNCSYGTNF